MTVEQDDDVHMDGSVEIEEVGSNDRMNHQMMDLFKKAIAVQLRPIDSERTKITGMALRQLCMFAEEQLDALMDGLHRISLLQRRQSIALADLEIWLRGYHLTPSSLYQTMEQSNYIRDTYDKEMKVVEALLPKEDDLANTAFGRVIPSVQRDNEQTDDLDDIDEDDYELVEYQQQAIIQLFKKENVSKKLKRSKPSWLPNFPPDHTYKYTPSFNNVIHKETVVRQKLVEEGRLSEKALINLMDKFNSVVSKNDKEDISVKHGIEKENESIEIQKDQVNEDEDIQMTDVKNEDEIDISKKIENMPDENVAPEKPTDDTEKPTDEIEKPIEVEKPNIEEPSIGNENNVDEKVIEKSEETDSSNNPPQTLENEVKHVELKIEESIPKPTEPVISDEELAELETRAILYRVENKKSYLIQPMRESLKNGMLKELFENPTSKFKNFDVEAYAKHRIDSARHRVSDYEYEQLYLNHNPLLKLAKMKDAGVDTIDFQKEYQKCLQRTMKRFLHNIPVIKEERKRVHKQAMVDKETRIRNRLAEIRERKIKKEQDRIQAAKEMEAIEKANSLGILPESENTAALPAGAPLLIDPQSAVLVPQVAAPAPEKEEKEIEKVDVVPTDINDVNDEDLGLFGLVSSDEDDYDNEKRNHVTFNLADSDDEKIEEESL